ncbi:glutathione S-transferase [Yoonia litorea]|uniref:Glutathione S-transferase n=1 Tax=Yoonia litorea TaxID=1123755 RepID=A0A1I6MW15_9RHOB|nr:glutathione S-transferase [Yoonia litorea]SFS19896.1 Glutathione S-transferase [Yoonia litorea]
MKLLMSPPSPYARMIRILIRELDLMDTVEEGQITTTAFNSAPEIIAANPLGKIPALVRDDGPTLYDSRVIAQFLNAHAGSGLYPESRKWEVMTLEATAIGIMDSAVSMSYETRLRPESQQSPDWIEAQWEKAARGVKAVNDVWMSHLTGPINIGHIAMGSALAYLDLRHDARGWREGNDALAAWHDEFAQRPSMTETVPA